jgi:DNA polymerase III epsilon subunit family exonuclease
MQTQNTNAYLSQSQDNFMDTPLSKLVFVAFDTETTGLNPETDKLVEIAAIKFLLNGKIISTYTKLINPQIAIPEKASSVHGITDDMVINEKPIDDVLPDFISWLNEKNDWLDTNASPVILAHNAPFDLSFLRTAINTLNLVNIENHVICTLRLSYKLVNDSPNHQLRTLTEYFGIQSSSYHRALADSHHVVGLFTKLVEKLPTDSTLAHIAKLCGLLNASGATDETSYKKANLPRECTQIQEAIDAKAKLRLHYTSSKSTINKNTERIVTPLSILNSRGNYYLSAYCHLAGEDRTFRIDRIIKLEIMSNNG